MRHTIVVLATHLVLPLVAILPVYSQEQSVQNITLSPINPLPTQCEPFEFRWSGGTPPFFVQIKLEGDDVLRSLGPTKNTSLSWITDFPGGTTGLTAQVSGTSQSKSDLSSKFAVLSGQNNDCLGNFNLPSTVASAKPITTRTHSSSSSSEIHSSIPLPSSEIPTTQSTSAIGTANTLSSLSSLLSPFSGRVLSVTTSGSSLAASSNSLALSMPSSHTPTPSSLIQTLLSLTPTSSSLVLIPPSSTSTSSTSRTKHSSHVKSGVIVGISLGLGGIVISIALVLFWHIKQRRGHTSASDVKPFIDLSTSEDLSKDQNFTTVEDGDTQANSSLVAQASSVALAPQNIGASVSHLAQGRGVDSMLVAEKLLYELRGQSNNRGHFLAVGEQIETEHMEAEAIPVESILCQNCAEHRGGFRRMMDAGVRLAGGPAGGVATEYLDQYSLSENSTLPPAYSSDFGEN